MNASLLEPVDESTNLALLPRADAVAVWSEYQQKAEALKATAETLSVTSVEDIAGQKLARQTRLSLREIRLAVEKRRVEMVEEMTKETRRINSNAKAVKDFIEPLEARLLEQEQFIERETTRLENERRISRADALRPFLQSLPSVDLGKIAEDEFDKMLADAKDLHELRLKREREAEEARIAKEKAEAEERGRIRAENERLRLEAQQREAQMEAERKAAEERIQEERRIQEEKDAAAKRERDALEAKVAKERRDAEKKLQDEREAADKARREAEEKAKAEREKAQEEADAKLKQEREEAAARQAKADATARREREAREEMERQQQEREAEERRAQAEAAEAERKAAAAPDKEKLLAYAERLSAFTPPEGTTPEAKVIASKIRTQLTSLTRWIEANAAAL